MTTTSAAISQPAADLTVTQRVAAIYAAFGQGDVAGVLEHLDPDVSWDADWHSNLAQRHGVVTLQPRRGPGEVAEFFTLLAGFTMHDFQVLDLMASATQVTAQVVLELSYPEGPGRLRDEELHLWTFAADGRVTALRHYCDTAKHIAAAGGVDTTRPDR